MSVTQGERGPPGNNGEKGERGDYVSNKKKKTHLQNNHNASRSSSVLIASPCVFQGEPGVDGERGERVNDFHGLSPLSSNGERAR